MLDPRLSRLAVCSVVVLIAVLSYPAQLYLFRRFWSAAQFYAFNTLVACVWISYFRTMLTDPGSPPRNWVPPVVGADDAEDARGRHENRRLVATGGRWCKRCQRFKPARTHHCRTCKRCILRMDHHCPWTNCCIGYRNTPHFLRFLFYTTIATSYLLLHLLSRAYAVWITRHRPAYYSPHTFPQLLLLASLLLISAPLSLTLLVLVLRTAVQAATGYTTIETWELDHHRALVRRGVTRNQVFPYDVGLWENVVAAFGYRWFFPLWLNPFTPSPRVGERIRWVQKGLAAGIEWEVNGFEPLEKEWPPKDPEKLQLRRERDRLERSGVVSILEDSVERVDWAGEVRRRQATDRKRWEKPAPAPRRVGDYIGDSFLSEPKIRRGAAGEWVSIPHNHKGNKRSATPATEEWGDNSIFSVGEAENWRNDDGERLADYGVDEEVEDEDEDVPLAMLIRRRQAETERVGRVLGEVNRNELWGGGR